jgi:PPOX class probable F420-dependent enzyme
MEIDEAVRALRNTRQSVLVTLKRDGHPQLSNVLHVVGDDGVARISITATRAKFHNVRRTPWAALHVNGSSFWSYAVVECDAALGEVVTDPDGGAADELVEHYRAAAGKDHDDWAEYRESLVSEQRVVLALTPRYAYGMLRG